MPQKQVGWRFDPWVLDRFREVCRSSGFKPSRVVEEFMRVVVDVGDPRIVLDRVFRVSDFERRGVERQARILLSMLRRGVYWLYEGDESYSVEFMLLKLLPRIEDEELAREIEEELSKVRGEEDYE